MRHVRFARSTVMAPAGQFLSHMPQKTHFITLLTIWLRSSIASMAAFCAATVFLTSLTPSFLTAVRMISVFVRPGIA